MTQVGQSGLQATGLQASGQKPKKALWSYFASMVTLTPVRGFRSDLEPEAWSLRPLS